MPVRSVLIGFGDGERLRLLIQAADEGDAGRRMFVGEAVGYDYGGVPSVVGDLQRVPVKAGRDEDIHLPHDARHIMHQ